MVCEVVIDAGKDFVVVERPNGSGETRKSKLPATELYGTVLDRKYEVDGPRAEDELGELDELLGAIIPKDADYIFLPIRDDGAVLEAHFYKED